MRSLAGWRIFAVLIRKKNAMNYTAKQIENAKARYNAMMVHRTIADYDIATIGRNEAERRCEQHNEIVDAVKAGDKEVIVKWKKFFLNDEVAADQKEAASKAKLAANKAAAADILEPIKKLRKLGEFGKWLNTSGNPYRKQHFSKKYTAEAVEGFLSVINK